MTRYRVVFTDAARESLRELDGAERLAGIDRGALSREAMRALLGGTALGALLEDLEALSVDPYGGLSLTRTAEAEDDRTALLGPLAVTFMISAATEPPVITITRIRQAITAQHASREVRLATPPISVLGLTCPAG